MNDLRKKFFITLGIFIIAGSIVLGVFFYLFLGVIAPISIEFRTVQENIKIADVRTSDFTSRVAPALKREEENISKIEGAFFVYSPDTVKKFIIFLETAAKRNNLVGDIASLPSATSLTASMNLSGTFADVITFLREIENGPILLGIDSVSFRGSGKTIAFSIQIHLPTPPTTH